MPFVPVGPADLPAELAHWIDGRAPGRQRIGIDGFAECGAAALADAVGTRLEAGGRPVVRVSTRWWWRPAALRLELGRENLDSLIGGWVDVGALHREVIGPLGPDGSGRHLTRLRDPDTDRAVRQLAAPSPDATVLLIDGPLLLSHEVPWDGLIHVQVSPGFLARALPATRQWWVAGYTRYLDDFHPESIAEVVLSYDHPAAPAVRWPIGFSPRRASRRSPG